MELKQIKTTLPFTDEELDTYFDDIESYYFHIDLDRSQYHGKQLLTYIYNSGMKANIESDQLSERLEEILLEYIKTSKILDIQSLNNIWVDILMKQLTQNQLDKASEEYQTFITNFCEKHQDVISELIAVLKGLKHFLLEASIYGGNNLPEEGVCELSFKNVGENIVSLRHAVCFWDLFGVLNDTDKYQYKEFVTDSFDGKKIAYFFFNEFNPLGLMYMARNLSDEDREELKKGIEA